MGKSNSKHSISTMLSLQILLRHDAFNATIADILTKALMLI